MSEQYMEGDDTGVDNPYEDEEFAGQQEAPIPPHLGPGLLPTEPAGNPPELEARIPKGSIFKIGGADLRVSETIPRPDGGVIIRFEGTDKAISWSAQEADQFLQHVQGQEPAEAALPQDRFREKSRLLLQPQEGESVDSLERVTYVSELGDEAGNVNILRGNNDTPDVVLMSRLSSPFEDAVRTNSEYADIVSGGDEDRQTKMYHAFDEMVDSNLQKDPDRINQRKFITAALDTPITTEEMRRGLQQFKYEIEIDPDTKNPKFDPVEDAVGAYIILLSVDNLKKFAAKHDVPTSGTVLETRKLMTDLIFSDSAEEVLSAIRQLGIDPESKLCAQFFYERDKVRQDNKMAQKVKDKYEELNPGHEFGGKEMSEDEVKDLKKEETEAKNNGQETWKKLLEDTKAIKEGAEKGTLDNDQLKMHVSSLRKRLDEKIAYYGSKKKFFLYTTIQSLAVLVLITYITSMFILKYGTQFTGSSK